MRRLVADNQVMQRLLFLLTTALLAACSSTNVESVQQTPGVDFTAYRTYNFLDVKARNESTFQQAGNSVEPLKQAVARELERRGYQRADDPDLWINIGVVAREQVQTRQSNFVQDAPRYLGQRRYQWQSGEVEVRRYDEGTATVDVVDATRNERIWQGVASSTLTRDPEKLAQRIDAGIKQLFAEYPVPPRQ
jgi:Holliday junction resolvase-like predicted endonuclease